jgi:hypothetical protein
MIANIQQVLRGCSLAIRHFPELNEFSPFAGLSRSWPGSTEKQWAASLRQPSCQSPRTITSLLDGFSDPSIKVL